MADENLAERVTAIEKTLKELKAAGPAVNAQGVSFQFRRIEKDLGELTGRVQKLEKDETPTSEPRTP
jgi:hypothetical protein